MALIKSFDDLIGNTPLMELANIKNEYKPAMFRD